MLDGYSFNSFHHENDSHIDSGAYRSVYVYDATSVVKIARNKYNVRANENEVVMWQKIKYSQDERYFARLLEWTPDYTWIIQERIIETVAAAAMRQYPYLDRFAYDAHFTHIPGAWEVVNVMRQWGLGDTHSYNLGLRADGSVCIIDYAQ